MQVSSGQKYTFTFTSDGFSFSDEFAGTGNVVANAIVNAGFPVSGLKWTAAGLSVDVNFQYDGASVDSDSLGKAMENEINNNASGLWNFSGAVAGTPIANPSTPGADLVNKTIAALPSPGNAALIVLAVLLAVVFVYSFAGSAGAGLAAKA